MMAFAGLVHRNGVGETFQDFMYALIWARKARLESKSESPSDCLPRMPKKPST